MGRRAVRDEVLVEGCCRGCEARWLRDAGRAVIIRAGRPSRVTGRYGAVSGRGRFGTVRSYAVPVSGQVAVCTEVAATVNGEEISIHQVRALLKRQPGLLAQGDRAGNLALDTLTEQELAAQAARKDGLDKSPEVIQALEVAKRDVLARAYQDQVMAKVNQPDTETIERYYDAHPELFAHRKLYTLVETMISGEAEALKGLATRAESLGSLDALRNAVLSAGLRQEVRTHTLLAEDVPLEVLPKLVYLKDGQSIVLRKPEGLDILTVTHSEERPLNRSEASQRIMVVIMGEARRAQWSTALAGLRKDAKIVRNPPFAEAASGAASSASSAQAASAP